MLYDKHDLYKVIWYNDHYGFEIIKKPMPIWQSDNTDEERDDALAQLRRPFKDVVHARFTVKMMTFFWQEKLLITCTLPTEPQ